MKRKVRKKEGPLVVITSAEEIEKLAEKAMAALDKYFEEDADDYALHVDVTPALEAIRFCAISAGALGDVRLLSLIDRLFDYASDFDGYADDHPRAIGGALTTLVAASSVDAKVRELAEHENETIRQAVASGLDPKKPGALDLLHELANDASPSVRRAARNELGPDNKPPWWFGKFASDPMTRLSIEDAARLEAPLRKIAELAEGGGYEVEQRRDQILKEIEKLPDDLAAEVCERSIRGTSVDSLYRAPWMISALISRGELGWLAFDREMHRIVAAADQIYTFHSSAKKAMERVDSTSREAYARWLMKRLGSISQRDRTDAQSFAAVAAQLIEGAWPREAPIAPVLDFIEAFEPIGTGQYDHVRATLAQPLRHHEKAPDQESAIVRAVGAWIDKPTVDTYALASLVRHDLEVLPLAARRKLVDRAIVSDDLHVQKWAVRSAIEQSYDEELDGPKIDLIERFDRDERMGPILRRTVAEYRLPDLRKKLRAGTLPYEEALATLEEIRDLWPDIANRKLPGLKAEQNELFNKSQATLRKKRLAQLKPYLGPKSMQGRATPIEWANFRVARDSVPHEDRKDWRKLLMLLPEGETRDPADDAVIVRAIERARSDGDGTAAYVIAPALTLAPNEGDLARLDDVESFSEGIYGETIREARATIRAKLGMPPEPEEEDDDDGGGEEGGGDDEVDELEAWGDDD